MLKVLVWDSLLLAALDLASNLEGAERVPPAVPATAVSGARVPLGPLHVAGGGVARGFLGLVPDARFWSKTLSAN